MNKEIISKIELDSLVEDLGITLTSKCHEYGGGIVFVCVMKGGFMFFSDLIKHIKYPIEVDFVKCSSYDDQEQKSIEMHYDIEANIKDKTVFIVDDILDTGNTMNELKKHYMLLGAKQVETVTCIEKPNVLFPNHYSIYQPEPNDHSWYVGYGLDDPKGYQRNLPYFKKF